MIFSSASSRTRAFGLARRAATAGMSSEATIASDTASLTPRRLATAASAFCARAVAMTSSRSASESSGEYSRMGAETVASTSRASLSTTSRGTQSRPAISSAENRAHPRRLIVGQFLQRFERQLADAFAFRGEQVGKQPADLARKLRAHHRIDVLGENPVGLGGRRRIGRDRAPRRLIAVRRQVIEHLRFGVGASRQAPAAPSAHAIPGPRARLRRRASWEARGHPRDASGTPSSFGLAGRMHVSAPVKCRRSFPLALLRCL